MTQGVNNLVGGGFLIGSGVKGAADFIASNATALSVMITFLSFLVGAVFLYLNWSSTRKHQAEMRDMARRDLDLKLAQATKEILSQHETQQDA